ncbi:MAG: site-specific DNA-methyltransferase [Candidatus Cloacimonas acidaminovorans]|nr:site-specific DNA-methyltransferase [Candidatus Cloacimonas acidaminovorans]
MVKISNKWNSDSILCLFQGDCLELLDSIPDAAIQLVVTSPPYNIGKKYEKRQPLDEYIDWQKKVITECCRVLKKSGSICWQVGNYIENGEIIPLDILLYPVFAESGLKLRNRIIWHFGHGLHSSKRFSGRYEVILWFTKSDEYIFNLDPVRIPQKYPNKKYFKGDKKGELSCNPLGKNPSDVWNIPNVKANHIEKTIHPAQFPVELVERLILSMTNENDWTLDPFMGTGTTQIASLIHNRKSCGAELFDEYYEIALQRINSAISGELKIRPMNRPIFDPEHPISFKPITVNLTKIKEEQSELDLVWSNEK